MTLAAFINHYSAHTLSYLVVLGLPVLVGAAIWADLRLPRPSFRQRIPNLALGIGLGVLALTLLLLTGFDLLPSIQGNLSLAHVRWLAAAPPLSAHPLINSIAPFLVLAIPYLTVGLALGFFCPDTKRGRVAIVLSWICLITALHLVELPAERSTAEATVQS